MGPSCPKLLVSDPLRKSGYTYYYDNIYHDAGIRDTTAVAFCALALAAWTVFGTFAVGRSGASGPDCAIAGNDGMVAGPWGKDELKIIEL